MLEGVVPYPPEFQEAYREKGYWEDRSLRDELQPCLEKFAERVAVIDETGRYTYGELDRMSTDLALNLVALGLKPLDRVVIQPPQRQGVRGPLRGVAEGGLHPDRRAGYPPVRGDRPVRRALRRDRLRHPRRHPGLRLSRDGGQGPGGERPLGASHRDGRGDRGFVVAARADRTAAGARRGRAGRDRDRSGRPRGVPAFRRHHRDPEADPAHP